MTSNDIRKTQTFQWTWTRPEIESILLEEAAKSSPVFKFGFEENAEFSMRFQRNDPQFKGIKDYLNAFLRVRVPDDFTRLTKLIWGYIRPNGEKHEVSNSDSILTVNKPVQSQAWWTVINLNKLLNAPQEKSFFINDNLIFFCELIFYVRYEVPTCTLSEDFSNLLESSKFSDVTLQVGNTEIKAHKAVLATRCPVFAGMFDHQMSEMQCNRVEITDFDPEVVKEMLRFIYSGKSPNIKEMADVLLPAADKYLLNRLKGLCEETLLEQVQLENAADLIILADLYSAERLKAGVLNFIIEHGKKIRTTPGWKSLTQTHPQLMTLASQKVDQEGK